MVTFVMPHWQQTKMVLTKGSRVISLTELKNHTLVGEHLSDDILRNMLETAASNLKQSDMFVQFPKYMARHVFVKVMKKEYHGNIG